MTEGSTTFYMIAAVQALLAGLWLCWVYSSVLISMLKIFGKPTWPWLNLIWFYTRPFAQAHLYCYWPAELLISDVQWWDFVAFATAAYCWYAYKNVGDDDDHKKLKKKLNEIVKVLNGRLVVKPT